MDVLVVLVNTPDFETQEANILFAIECANQYINVRVDWFLSGANKTNSKISEAQKMSEIISIHPGGVNKRHWHYIHDYRSTTIQGNLVRLSEWLEFNLQSYKNIYVFTSDKQAESIADTIIPNNNFKWTTV